MGSKDCFLRKNSWWVCTRIFTVKAGPCIHRSVLRRCAAERVDILPAWFVEAAGAAALATADMMG